MPLAHETWFVPDRPPLDAAELLTATTPWLLAAAVVLVVVVRLVARAVPGADVPALARLVPFLPFAARLHVGVSLVGLLSMGSYLSPAMDLPVTVGGVLLGVTMGAAAVGLLAGWRTREAALLLLCAGPLGMVEFGVGPVLQRVDLLGMALFVLLAGPGRWSADHEQGRVGEPAPLDLARAVWALKVGAGSALIVVALYEKLAAPEMALAFLREHPEFNVAQLVGLGWSDLAFTRVAGAVEVLFGLLLISGALAQAAVLVAGVPFNVTLWFFGTAELLGHLPVYGAMLILLVLASDPVHRPAVAALRPPGRRTTSSATSSSATPRPATWAASASHTA
jgi:hypothetical protein